LKIDLFFIYRIWRRLETDRSKPEEYQWAYGLSEIVICCVDAVNASILRAVFGISANQIIFSGKMPDKARCERIPLHDSVSKHFVFSGEQILHEIVTAFIGIARGAGKMMIDSHLG